MAQYIRAQGALFGISAGRLVVGNALGRHQQGRDGINQRRFARADVAGQQGVFTGQIKCPDFFVKSAPVEDLKPHEAKAREGVKCGPWRVFKAGKVLLNHRELALHQTRQAAPDTPTAASQTPPATAHLRKPSGCAALQTWARPSDCCLAASGGAQNQAR